MYNVQVLKCRLYFLIHHMYVFDKRITYNYNNYILYTHYKQPKLYFSKVQLLYFINYSINTRLLDS